MNFQISEKRRFENPPPRYHIRNSGVKPDSQRPRMQNPRKVCNPVTLFEIKKKGIQLHRNTKRLLIGIGLVYVMLVGGSVARPKRTLYF